MKSLLAIRHVHFEDLGSLHVLFEGEGFSIRYLEAGLDDLSETDPFSPDLLVVLGGPIGAYDEAIYPFLSDEVNLLKARLEAGRPTLGFCLGAQLMARALGSRVFPGPAREIGWQGLRLTEAGKNSPVRHLDARQTSMLHWHGDTFDLPAGANLLASTEACAQQIFSWGDKALAFQCHPEFDAARVESWLIGHAAELAAAGLSVSELRRDSTKYGRQLQEQARRCITEWLKAIAL